METLNPTSMTVEELVRILVAYPPEATVECGAGFLDITVDKAGTSGIILQVRRIKQKKKKERA